MSLVDFRRNDLGQYLFVKAIKATGDYEVTVSFKSPDELFLKFIESLLLVAPSGPPSRDAATRLSLSFEL